MADNAKNLPHLTAETLRDDGRIRHAFFTRQGGVSGGIYESLNIGLGSKDEKPSVTENRRRVAAFFDLPGEALNTVYQVHGSTTARVDGPWADGTPPQADAMVTDRPGSVLGILSADCTPVLFADRAAGVVGAAHAGWKGAVGGILPSVVEAMEALGAQRQRIAAAIGPTIAQASYEVGPEFPAPFLAQDPANEAFFMPSERDGHFMFDLPGYVAKVLRSLKVGSVEDLARDTCAETDLFYSYRRATKRGEPDYGRCVSAIAIAEA
ncbi:MAG: peptidoglycan editing factor PgeF [Rhodospirillaceae bacterium]|nr:peptidoglycan editing factor PgeF [Rhodospirillaceae bacterium]